MEKRQKMLIMQFFVTKLDSVGKDSYTKNNSTIHM